MLPVLMLPPPMLMLDVVVVADSDVACFIEEVLPFGGYSGIDWIICENNFDGFEEFIRFKIFLDIEEYARLIWKSTAEAEL